MSIRTDLYSVFSDQTDTLRALGYVTAELLLGTIRLHPAVAPACLWMRLDGHCEAPAWLLTPDSYGVFWAGVARAEEAWVKGKQPLDRMTEMWRRWALVEAFAEQTLDAADLGEAKSRALAGKARKLCPPPLYCWHPWPETG